MDFLITFVRKETCSVVFEADNVNEAKQKVRKWNLTELEADSLIQFEDFEDTDFEGEVYYGWN